MEGSLPTGTVTFLFTDVEGSTKLLHELGPERYAQALAEHRRVLREAFERHGGVEVDTQGDAFFVAFASAPDAVAAARDAQDALAIPVRMGIHTGTPLVTAEGYIGADVHRAARIAAAGHGGQVLVSASTSALVDEELRDLGEHRLKDLSAPERILQLGEKEFPPLKTLYRTNLPVPATPFLGREQQLATVLELLDRTRLLTLTGPGGTGKTRLALQAAAEASERFPDGVFWVPLAPLRDPDLVLETAAQALGANDGVADHVGDKQLLLLLDNFEHLMDAADELAGLQASCPNLRVLVTSREILRLPGEQAYPVPTLEPGDGTELFLARARAVNPNFEPDERVGTLCARLDNLPLALELAAARTSILNPAQLLERLVGRLDLLKAGRGVDARQQTLRAAIEWSYDLLDEEEQRLFAHLAVFRGGCTLEAAEAVCGADVDTLESLVDKSLLRVRDESRFWMLETIREYAVERLEASGEEDNVRDRHAGFFRTFAAEARPHLEEESPEWLDRVEAELDNLRAVLDRLEGEELLSLAASLNAIWAVRGSLAEGRRRLEDALAADDNPSRARASALTAAADMALGQGDDGAVKARGEEALALHRRFGDAWGTVETLLLLAHAAADERDFERCRELAGEAADLTRDDGHSQQALQATWQLGWAHVGLGERERGRLLYEEALHGARESDSTYIQSLALSGLAQLALRDGRPRDAIQLIAESYALSKKTGDRWRIAIDACRLARALAALGDAPEATRLLASGQQLFAEIGGAPSWLTSDVDETREFVAGRLGEAELAAEWQRGQKVPTDEAIELALASLSGGA